MWSSSPGHAAGEGGTMGPLQSNINLILLASRRCIAGRSWPSRSPPGCVWFGRACPLSPLLAAGRRIQFQPPRPRSINPTPKPPNRQPSYLHRHPRHTLTILKGCASTQPQASQQSLTSFSASLATSAQALISSDLDSLTTLIPALPAFTTKNSCRRT